MAKCVVTGGAGFIGTHLVGALKSAGHTVIVHDIRRKQYPVAGVEYIPRNILGTLPADYAGADVVFHLAAVSRTVPAIEDPCGCVLTNVMGTTHVLEMARGNRVPRVVVSSSNVVLAGCTPYRMSKQAVEDICDVYAELYDQSVMALRYSNVYGSGIPAGDPAVFAMLRDSFWKNGYATVTGDGEQTRDFTHVSDIVQANLLAWKSSNRQVLDICTGMHTSINEACKLLQIPVRYTADRPGDIKEIYQDRMPAKHIIDWEPRVQIEEGINDIWDL